MIRIRPTLPGDCWLLLADLRKAETDEFDALGVNSELCMRMGMLNSDARTVFIDDEPAAMFGIIPYEDHNVAWAVFTHAIERHPIAFLRESRRVADSFDCAIVNYVDARNTKAVKWFKWLGFHVWEPEPYGPHGALFQRFTNRLQHLEGATVTVIADGMRECA